jgi:hypothetical protein
LRPAVVRLGGLARGLLYSWRRRVAERLGWVKAPRKFPCIVHHYPERTMTWTKPEAEVVAVTMEVTAYVATL